MGLGFVLLIYLTFLSLIAILPAIFLGAWASSLTSGQPPMKRLIRIVFAAAAPYLSIAYLFAAFIFYAAWCDQVRGVDPGLGDGWYVPIHNGYRLSVIDTFKDAGIAKGHGRYLSGVESLGVQGEFVYGKAQENPGPFHNVIQPPYFLFNTMSAEKKQFESVEELHSAMKAQGLDIPGEMQSTVSFYRERRWGFPDLAAAALILGLPAVVGFRPMIRNYFPQFLETRFYAVSRLPSRLALCFGVVIIMLSCWWIYSLVKSIR